MNEHRGWLLDLYPDGEAGLALWLLDEAGVRRRLHHAFPVTFYAAGPFSRLRQVWRFLQNRPAISLARTRRADLFAGGLDVLAVTVAKTAVQPRLFHEIARRFPDLDYYDADIPIGLRYAAATAVFPLARCHILADDAGRIHQIRPLDSPWDLEPLPPPLKTLVIQPDVNPAHAEPTALIIQTGSSGYRMPLKPMRLLLIQLQASLKRVDPDLILTDWGDTWLFPTLLAACQAGFNPNRDQRRRPVQRQENSYFTYGQVVYRGRQVHLFGRWHIDRHNSMMFGDYGLEGVFEQARVTGLPVQEIARKSPGSGVTAMQMQTALREGIMVPYQKQQAERFKTAMGLIRADRGGLVYQPITGLHHDVAEMDFVSMYPAVMVRFNLSPETVGQSGENARPIPDLENVFVDQSREGLVPKTLRPLLAKRVAIKQRLAEMNHYDCRYRPFKARAAALKWLLVVCFGYLGYKNARFGRIESHEAVTAYGREVLLQAKEAAEDLGFTVLHMYVDGLWVKREGAASKADFQQVLDEIIARTGLPIVMDGIYRWVAFLPSRSDPRVPVANRYFGVFRDGQIKIRGIEARRHDTAPFIAQTQQQLLQRLARQPDTADPAAVLADAVVLLRRTLVDLRAGRIPLKDLLVSQTLSRLPEEYRQPSPSALAAIQLQGVGKQRRPGQRIRFVYTLGKPGVWAWDLPQPPDPDTVDTARYTTLLIRAAIAVLQPFGIDEKSLRDWLLGGYWQRPLAYLEGMLEGCPW